MGNDARSDKHEADTESTMTAIDFAAVQQSDQFKNLRKRLRNFVLPVTGLCLLWYLAYVLLAGYAPEFMSIQVFGSVNVGLLLGLAQIVTTFVVTMVYVSFANRRLDPIATEIREDLEKTGTVR